MAISLFNTLSLSIRDIFLSCFITPSGEKHGIDYGIYPNEITLAYKELLDHSKQRGLKGILLFVGNEFQGLQQACQEV